MRAPVPVSAGRPALYLSPGTACAADLADAVVLYLYSRSFHVELVMSMTKEAYVKI